MIPYTAKQIIDIVNGKLLRGDENQKVTGACAYLETLEPNMLLFLRYQRVNDWEIFNKNVPCIVVANERIAQGMIDSDKLDIEKIVIISVKDIDYAYWQFVEHYRGRFDIPVIAITGTSGKTTTKDMIKHILSKSMKVEGTRYSANGRTGHLTYLLRLDDSVQSAVYETAVGVPGDIVYSTRHFKPSIGIITNIGIDHLDGCKTLEAYVKAKAEMVTILPENGVLIINADDENIKTIDLSNFKGRVVRFGLQSDCDFYAKHIKYTINGMEFTLVFNKVSYLVFVPGYGEHQVYNALAAIACVHELGVGINESSEKLNSFRNLPRHLQIINGINKSRILDDTWNINPTSLEAALKTMTNISNNSFTIALIGSIGALGDLEKDVTVKVSEMLAQYNLDVIITVGQTAETIKEQVLERGYKGNIYAISNIKEQGEYLFDTLKWLITENTLLLAKCSMFDYDFQEFLKRLKM